MAGHKSACEAFQPKGSLVKIRACMAGCASGKVSAWEGSAGFDAHPHCSQLDTIFRVPQLEQRSYFSWYYFELYLIASTSELPSTVPDYPCDTFRPYLLTPVCQFQLPCRLTKVKEAQEREQVARKDRLCDGLTP